jgi:hypothetical protein
MKEEDGGACIFVVASCKLNSPEIKQFIKISAGFRSFLLE